MPYIELNNLRGKSICAYPKATVRCGQESGRQDTEQKDVYEARLLMAIRMRGVSWI